MTTKRTRCQAEPNHERRDLEWRSRHPSLAQLHTVFKRLGDQARCYQVSDLVETLDESHVSVVVFGDFNRGKSTLINALLGRRLLAAKLIPTTGHVTCLRGASHEEVEIRFADGRIESHPLDRLDSFAVLSDDGQVSDNIERITVFVASDLLSQNVMLIDTPGTNEAATQSARAERALRHADVVIWLLDARECLQQQERELAANWLKARPEVPIIPVLNFTNLLEDDAERDEVRVRLERWLKSELISHISFRPPGHDRLYFEVNVRAALLGTDKGNGEVSNDFAALKAVLAHLSAEEGRVLAQRSRVSQVRATYEQFDTGNYGRLKELEDKAHVARKERETQLGELRRKRKEAETSANLMLAGLKTSARSVLAETQSNICSWYSNETRARLDEHASGWYHHHLCSVATSLEGLVRDALVEIAHDCGRDLTTKPELPPPKSVSISVGSLPDKPASGGEVGGGAFLYGLLGTIVAGPFGTAIGASIGAALASQSTPATDAEYVSAFQTRACEEWERSERLLTRQMVSVFEATLETLLSEFSVQTAELEKPLPVETDAELIDRRQLRLLLEEFMATNCQLMRVAS